MVEKELRKKAEYTEEQFRSLFPSISPGDLMCMIYPPPPMNVLVQTLCQEKTEAGVQTSLKKASANKDVQTNQKRFTTNKHTWTKTGWFWTNSSVQTDNKKNSVPKSVSQSVQTDNEKNSVTQTVTQSVPVHDEEWQEVGANKNKHHNVIAKKSKEEFSLHDDNPFKVLGEQNNISANIEFSK